MTDYFTPCACTRGNDTYSKYPAQQTVKSVLRLSIDIPFSQSDIPFVLETNVLPFLYQAAIYMRVICIHSNYNTDNYLYDS